MAGKKLFLLLVFACAGLCHAQAQAGGFYMEQRFVQRLTWGWDEYVMRYEVIIEKDMDGAYRRTVREFTENSFIDVSLSPGKYRYRVILYDYFNRQSSGSGWIDFEVLPAFVPELNVLIPESVYAGDGQYILNIFGKNMGNSAEIYMRGNDGTIVVPEDIQILEDGSRARLVFSKEKTIPDYFEIVIINPGGLRTSMGGSKFIPPMRKDDIPEEEEVPVEKAVRERVADFYLGASWMPQVTAYGNADRLHEPNVILHGVEACLGMVFTNLGFIGIGPEVTVLWFVLDNDAPNPAAIGFNLLARKKTPNGTMAFSFRLGSSYSFSDQRSFQTTLGTSFLWRFWKFLYMDTGLNVIHINADENRGLLRPWIGIGLLF